MVSQNGRRSLARNSIPRLAYLDGVRGLAALYIVFGHAIFSASHMLRERFPTWLSLFTRPFEYGHFAVVVFIVLSGYVLMLPVAKSPAGELSGGFRGYMTRRAWRILPAFYAAFVLALPLAWIREKLFQQLHVVHTPISASALVSHLFLVQNLRLEWSRAVDVPLWTLGTEWQIYFIFPLLLLPIWRRFGAIASALTGLIVGMAPHCLLPRANNLDAAHFWFVGLFAMGMMAAVVNTPEAPGIPDRARKLPWGLFAAALGLSATIAAIVMPGYWSAHPWLIDPWTGAAAACIIIYTTRLVQSQGSKPTWVRFLESSPVVRLGGFSYSLYLIHYPIVVTLSLTLRLFVHSPATNVLIETIVAVPLAVCAAFAFYQVFERPFLKMRERHGAEAG